MNRFIVLWYLLQDFRACLRHEGHQSRKETYALVRHAYVATRGASRRALRWLYGKIRPVEASSTLFESRVLEALRRDGLAVVPRFLDAPTVGALREYFRLTPSHPVGKDFAHGKATTIDQAVDTPRLGYDTEVVLRAPGVRELLADRSIQHLAAAYLGCQPIFTSANAWWSVADPGADDEALSWAAQLFHFDYDWPAFVKFFFYLTDVGIADGPFTFVVGTHEAKRDWRDGRVTDDYIEATYGENVRSVTGGAGDMIVADTAGYHKGARVAAGGGPRLMLQIEYCVARLGSGYQYKRYPQSARPASEFKHTYDVFCEPR
jgi:hypothetical protein